MTYKRNFVCAVKVGGKILRENQDEVKLPFGSEYSILLKNMNSVRAQAQISIDGTEAGPWYILDPNSSVEIERFNTSGNSERGNRFKFIERTEAIEEHRGIKIEDGLIRVEFKKEKVWTPPVVEHHYHEFYYHRPYYYWPYHTWLGGNHTLTNSNSSSGLLKSAQTRSLGAMQEIQNNSVRPMAMNMMAQSNDAGITVPGSESKQQFTSVYGFETESQTEVITLKLFGHQGQAVVVQPVTVDVHALCQTCGKRAKGSAKFCSQCGTSLNIL